MNRLNIILLFPSPEEIGGVVYFCKRLINHLSEEFSVRHFIVGSKVGNKCFLKKLLNFIHLIFQLSAELKRKQYDIIHLNPSFESLALVRDSVFLWIVSKRGYTEKVVVFFHGWNMSLGEKVIKFSLLRKIFTRIYNRAGIIFVLHRSFKEQLIRMNVKPTSIKVTTTMYESISKTKSLHFRAKDAQVNILFMARLVRNKGVYIAAEVGKMLLEHGFRNFKLSIAGDGQEYKGLEDYIYMNGLEDYINLVGYINGEKKQEILVNSDIFLFPTNYAEGCPIVILEAMGAGAAVVSTPVAAIPDIVTNKENGFLIDSKSPKPFYYAVKKMLEDRELLERMKRKNRKKAEKNYEASVITKKIELVYKEIIYDRRCG